MDPLTLNEEFEIVFDNSDAARFLVDVERAKNFSFRRINQSCEQLTGFDEQEVRGKKLREVFGGSSGARLADYFHACVEQETTLTFTEQLKLPVGEKKLAVELNPVSKEGRVVRLLGTIRPASPEKNESDVKKRAKQAQFAKQRDSSRPGLDGVALANEAGEIFYANDDFARIFGLADKQEALGSHPLDLTPDSEQWKVEDFLELVEAEGLASREVKGLEDRGRIFDVQFNLSSVRDEAENIACTIVSFEDIEESSQREMELKLAQSSVDSAPLGIFWVTPEGEFEYVNNRACQMLNYSRSELLGRKISDLDRQLSVETRAKRWREVKEKNRASFESEYRTKDDNDIPVRVTGRYAEYQGREYELSFVQEITEERKREHELHNLSAAIEQSPAIVVITDVEGNIEYVNPKFTELTGYQAAEVKGESLRILKSGYHSEDFYRDMWETLFNGGEWHSEFLNRTKSGEFYWEEASIAPVFDDNGEITNFIKVAEDITAERKMRRSLEELNCCFLNFTEDPTQNFEQLVEVCGRRLAAEVTYLSFVERESPDCCANWTANEALAYPCEVFGELNAELIRENNQDLRIIKDLTESTFAESAVEIRDHGLKTYVGKVIRADGEALGTLGVVFSEQIQLSEHDKTVFNIVASALESEVLRFRLLEDLKFSNKQLKQFANLAAHDLKDPLFTVTGYVDLIKRKYGDQLPEEAVNFSDKAAASCHHMQEMLDGLLDFARVDTGVEEFQPVDVSQVVEEVLADLQAQLDESGARVIYEQLPVVEGERSLLARVFQNLISNALSYQGEESPVIEIAAEKSGGWVTLAVIDNGIGMSPEQTEEIFGLFERVEADEEIEGTGLGLAICRKIISLHGGKIWAESTPGEGTTFKMDLPLAE